jgi:probable HAF family extracellular repeat protein
MKTFFSLVFLMVSSFATAYAQPKYSVTAICQGVANSINNNGDVCGASSTTFHAFLYKKGKLADLGVWVDPQFPKDSNSTSGFAVNNSGFVVGSISNAPSGGNFTRDSFAYLNGKIVPIATGSGDGGFSSQAWAVNNSGWVVGSYDAGGSVTPTLGDATARAFLHRNGTTYNLGTLGGYFSEAFDINNAGQIVGSSTAVTGGLAHTPFEAFLYQNGKMRAIGGKLSPYIVPWAINDNGWIAAALYAYPVEFVVPDGEPGWVNYSLNNGTTNEQSSDAYVIVNNATWLFIGPGHPVSLNNSGTVIGTTDVYTTSGNVGIFIYGGGKTYDLNALVKGNWTITQVGHINDAGQIAATGIVKGSTNGATYALLLSPSNSMRP